MRKSPGATVFIDAVHYTPHNPVDVRALDCDFLGVLGVQILRSAPRHPLRKYEHLDRLEAYKVRPSYAKPPGKWETGTQSFESISGLRAALAYLAGVGGPGADVRDAMQSIREYELDLSRGFLEQARAVPGLKIYGHTDPGNVSRRTPTFGVTLEGWNAAALAARLGARGIFVWDGHFYAVGVVDGLGLGERGGLVRIGFAHYNTPGEVERVVGALAELAESGPG